MKHSVWYRMTSSVLVTLRFDVTQSSKVTSKKCRAKEGGQELRKFE